MPVPPAWCAARYDEGCAAEVVSNGQFRTGSVERATRSVSHLPKVIDGPAHEYWQRYGVASVLMRYCGAVLWCGTLAPAQSARYYRARYSRARTLDPRTLYPRTLCTTPNEAFGIACPYCSPLPGSLGTSYDDGALSNPVSVYSSSLWRVSTISRLRMVSWPMRSMGVKNASPRSIVSRSG